jgi:type I restriction enzyme S subunit
VKAGWGLAKIGDLLTIQNGFAFDSKNFSDSKGVPLIRIRDLKNGRGTETKYSGPFDKRYEVKAGDFLIGMDGEFGCYEWKDGQALLNQRVCRLQGFSERLEPKFLFYGINKHLKEIEDATTYTTVKHLSSKQISNIEIPLPPLPEQRRIIAILDEAFAGLGTATANTEKNLKNASELFDSYLEEIFTRKGENWVTTTVADVVGRGLIFSPQDGNHGEIHPKRSDFVEIGVPFIMASDLENGLVNCVDCNFISERTAAGLRKGFAKNGDVLLSHKGTIGRVAILDTEREFVVLTPQVTYYRVKDKNVLLNRFIRFLFESKAFQAQMVRIAGAGSTRAYIGITKQLELGFSYPSLAEQQHIVRVLDVLKAKSDELESTCNRKLAAIAELKQSILQKAFSGELTSPPHSAINEAAE